MGKDFIFIDDATDGKTRIFYRELFYKYITELIINIFNEKLEINETCKRFLNFLDTVEDAGDVYFLMHEEPYHWALSIIQNNSQPDENIMMNNDVLVEDEMNLYINFLKTYNIKSFLEEVE